MVLSLLDIRIALVVVFATLKTFGPPDCLPNFWAMSQQQTGSSQQPLFDRLLPGDSKASTTSTDRTYRRCRDYKAGTTRFETATAVGAVGCSRYRTVR